MPRKKAQETSSTGTDNNSHKKKNINLNSTENSDHDTLRIQHPNASNLAVRLPWFESVFYITTWSGIVAYLVWNVYRDSQKYAHRFSQYEAVSGWKILGGYKKDISNFEWEFWYGWAGRIWLWLAGHVISARITEFTIPWARKYVFLVYGLGAVTMIMGQWNVLIILVHLTVAYISSLFGSALLVWAVAVLLLATTNHDPFDTWMHNIQEDDKHQNKYYLLLFTVAMSNLRYITFALTKVQHEPNYYIQQDVKEGKGLLKWGFLDLLMFNFYLPTFFTGPVFTYEKFQREFNQPITAWSRAKLQPILVDTLRVMFWAVFYMVSSHLLYINALHMHYDVMKILPHWTLTGIGVLHGVYFQVKYVTMFGLPANLTKLDQFNPPLGPKCVLRIYYYSDMWKYFDRGLYSFLKTHIYIPLGGSRLGLSRQLLGSILCFCFIYYWHGAEKHLAIWSFLNFVGICLESVGKLLARSQPVVDIRTRYLSEHMYRRLQAVAVIPLWVMSIAAILYFFGGNHIGYLYFKRLILEGWPWTILMIVFGLYTAGQSAFDIERWEARRTTHLHNH